MTDVSKQNVSPLEAPQAEESPCAPQEGQERPVEPSPSVQPENKEENKEKKGENKKEEEEKEEKESGEDNIEKEDNEDDVDLEKEPVLQSGEDDDELEKKIVLQSGSVVQGEITDIPDHEKLKLVLGIAREDGSTVKCLTTFEFPKGKTSIKVQVLQMVCYSLDDAQHMGLLLVSRLDSGVCFFLAESELLTCAAGGAVTAASPHFSQADLSKAINKSMLALLEGEDPLSKVQTITDVTKKRRFQPRDGARAPTRPPSTRALAVRKSAAERSANLLARRAAQQVEQDQKAKKQQEQANARKKKLLEQKEAQELSEKKEKERKRVASARFDRNVAELRKSFDNGGADKKQKSVDKASKILASRRKDKAVSNQKLGALERQLNKWRQELEETAVLSESDEESDEEEETGHHSRRSASSSPSPPIVSRRKRKPSSRRPSRGAFSSGQTLPDSRDKRFRADTLPNQVSRAISCCFYRFQWCLFASRIPTLACLLHAGTYDGQLPYHV